MDDIFVVFDFDDGEVLVGIYSSECAAFRVLEETGKVMRFRKNGDRFKFVNSYYRGIWS